jgi:hypothetical protein
MISKPSTGCAEFAFSSDEQEMKKKEMSNSKSRESCFIYPK